MTAPAPIRAIVFDQGETIINETRFWSTVGAFTGVPDFTLFGVIGGMIERRESHQSIFNVMEIESVDPATVGYQVELRDLYPDVIPTLTRLENQGYLLGLTGNQPQGAAEEIAHLGLPFTMIGSSANWGVAKPDPAFFARIADELSLPPAQILYVGDRLDNDILPAQRFGMPAAFIRRGPWGYLHAAWPDAAQTIHRIETLTEIPDLVATLNRTAPQESQP